MKNENEEIDRLIEQALTEEEAAFYHKLDEQNLLEMVGGLFQGKMRWLTILTLVVQVVMFVFAVYFIYQFLTAEDLVLMLRYGAASFFFMMSVGMLKLFHWMEMNKNATIREIKRMEFQVSVLASKLKNTKAEN